MEKEKIKDIVDNLDLGMSCFIHSESKEIKFIPDEDKYYGMDMEFFQADIDEIENNFGDYIQISGMNSGDSFKVMEAFIETVDDDKLSDQLIDALNRPKPFRNFKFVVDDSGPYRDQWFKFKEAKMTEWVEAQLQEHGL
jgi:hypothetical protein